MCLSVSYMGTTCGGLLEGLGYPIDCAAKDNNGIPIFDATNDVSQCNDFSSSKVTYSKYIETSSVDEICLKFVFREFHLLASRRSLTLERYVKI